MIEYLCFIAVVALVAAGVVIFSWWHDRTQAKTRAARKHLALRMHPGYQAMKTAEHSRALATRRLDLALHEQSLREFQAMTQIPIAQYGMLVRESADGQWVHVAPIHKPIASPKQEAIETTLAVPAMRTFSQALTTFRPSAERILLGYLPGEREAIASAEGLCHVALAGATGGGKSVLIRLLVAQLCFVGASVLLLNPHYTRYDIAHNEDWTPFEPYLYDNPMRCRDYRVIGEYLRKVAQEMLPNRLERYAHSLPVGSPFYIVLDELPAIVKHVPEAPGYMADLLREGRKVGLFLVTAAQDFLVRTVMKEEGGAVRDCFRTAVYVGGDPTTARTLLDVKGTVDDGGLGKGVVMLRAENVKQASLARVPYVDNAALYQLLGPSTYEPVGRPTGFQSPVEDEEAAGSDYRDDENERGFWASTTVTGSLANSGKPLYEQSEATPRDYRFTETEKQRVIDLYKGLGSIDKVLREMKKSNRYFADASRIIREAGL